MNPTISVIVPAYNIAPYIERCVNSILAQTYTDFEIIIVNDGSTDDTPKICDKLAVQDERVKVIHKQNDGVSAARNDALKVSKGKYISIIDGDDWVENTLFEDAVNAMDKHKAQCFMFEYFVDSENETVTHSVDDSKYGLISKEKALEYSIGVENRFAWSKIFEKSLSNNIEFNSDIILGEDTLYICSVLQNAESVVYSNKNYYHYIVREGSAVNSAFNREKLSGVDAYQGVVDLAVKLNYKEFENTSRLALINLSVALAKKILVTENYNEKNDDLKMLRKTILSNKKHITSSIDTKTKIKLLLTSISIKLLKVI